MTSPDPVQKGNDTARYWMELLTPTTAKVLARYDHLLSAQAVSKDSPQQLAPWGVMIVLED